jgi:phenylacetate-CoA ligase
MNQPGIKKAINIFQASAKSVPAYKSFLQKKKIKPSSIKTQADFKKLPITDKNNYIKHYSLIDRVSHGQPASVIYASSGSSGKPTFWFNNKTQEHLSGLEHVRLFRDVLQIKKQEPTLVIVCFAMGLWIAGPHSVNSCRQLAKYGFNVTVSAPGYNLEDILAVLKEVAPLYKNIIFFGHPPRLMDIMHSVVKKRLFKKTQKIKLITSGDAFDEKWRQDMAELLHIKESQHSIINLYGSTDAGAMAYETPLTIFLRQESLKRTNLYFELFGEAKSLPALYQYNPQHIFFENPKQELIITSNTANPLVRYNIRDIGNVITYQRLKNILKNNSLISKAKYHDLNLWSRPLVIVSGRSDVATRFYALAIYPEHIQASLEARKISQNITDNYLVYTETTKKNKIQKFHIELELKPGINPSKKLESLIQKNIAKTLSQLSAEYRKLYSIMGSKSLPVITLHKNGIQTMQQKKVKGILKIHGKKPRMIH